MDWHIKMGISLDKRNYSSSVEMMSQYGLLVIVAIACIAGVLDASPPKKIVGGTNAVLGEFPYHVALRFKGQNFCGGAIISSRHVLTAAHCVAVIVKHPSTDFVISTGSVEINSAQNYTIKSTHSHSEFISDLETVSNDIAIIELNEEIIFDNKKQKVALPSEPTPGGVIANVTGWGSTEAWSPFTSNDLLKITVTTLTNVECQPYFKEHTTITVQHICTNSTRGIGICGSDSGGPLVRDNILIGIASFGQPCGTGIRDVYTNVYHYLDWIRPYI